MVFIHRWSCKSARRAPRQQDLESMELFEVVAVLHVLPVTTRVRSDVLALWISDRLGVVALINIFTLAGSWVREALTTMFGHIVAAALARLGIWTTCLHRLVSLRIILIDLRITSEMLRQDRTSSAMCMSWCSPRWIAFRPVQVKCVQGFRNCTSAAKTGKSALSSRVPHKMTSECINCGSSLAVYSRLRNGVSNGNMRNSVICLQKMTRAR